MTGIGKLPFSAEFIRFQAHTVETQQFASWLDKIYRSAYAKNEFEVYPVPFLWKESKGRFILGSVCGSQDSKGRQYPFGLARWSQQSFKPSFYEALDHFEAMTYSSQQSFEQAFQALHQEGADISSFALSLKVLQGAQPLFYSLLAIFKSLALRLNTIPQYQAIEIPLPSGGLYRAQLSVIKFWIDLTERVIHSVQWQQVYWGQDKLLIAFKPLTPEQVIGWRCRQKPSAAWISLSEKIAVDANIQEMLDRQLKEPIQNLDALLEKLS